jgi:hypothetical protein
MEYIYFNQGVSEWRNVPIDAAKYAKFFEMVSWEKSLLPVSTEVAGIFKKPLVSRLLVSVEPSGSDRTQSGQKPAKIFQEINFSPDGDYFRVELRVNNTLGNVINDPNDHWVYFYYPKIYQETLTLFNSSL